MRYPTKDTKLGQIKVRVRREDGTEGWQEVRAWTKGDLAIHKSVSFRWYSERYTITHVPTGYAIGVQRKSLGEARSVLDELEKLDWSFSEEASMPEATKEGARLHALRSTG